MISSSAVITGNGYEDILVNKIKQRDFSLSFREHANYNDCYSSLSYSSCVTTTKSKISGENSPLILIPKNAESPKIHKFDTELEYEGYVISVNHEERSFTARIVNVMSSNDEEEEGEFSLDELDGDETLVIPGAVFTWVVGLQSRGRSKQRVSDIRFRRHTALPIELISKAESEAIELSNFLSNHESNQPITLVID